MNVYQLEKLATPGVLYSGVWDGESTTIWTDDSLATLARFKSEDDSRFALHCRNNFMKALETLAYASALVLEDHEESSFAYQKLIKAIGELEEVDAK